MAEKRFGSLGERLAYLRSLTDLKARALDRLVRGRALGTTYTRLVETGARPRINADLANRYAMVLGCSLDWLVRGEGRAPSKAAVLRAVAVATTRSREAA